MVDGRENKWIPEGSVSVKEGYKRRELSEKTLRSIVEGFNKIIKDRYGAWIEVKPFNRDYRIKTKNTNFHCTLHVVDRFGVHTQDFGIYPDFSWGLSLWDVRDRDSYLTFWDRWVSYLKSIGIHIFVGRE